MIRKKESYFMGFFLLFFCMGLVYEQSDTVMKQTHQAVIASTNTGVHVGDYATNFTLLNTKGESVSLHDLRGKKVIVNFFATWCAPCQEEMPLLTNIAEQVNDDTVVVLGVNMTQQEQSPNDVRPFLQHFKVPYDVVFDIHGVVMDDYQIVGIPTTIVINEKGVIVHRLNGMLTEERIKPLGLLEDRY